MIILLLANKMIAVKDPGTIWFLAAMELLLEALFLSFFLGALIGRG